MSSIAPTKMQQAPKQFEAARGWPYFAALFVIAILAFWPSYFSPGLGTSSVYTHIHAATAALWMCMLIVQPWLIRTYRFDLHRTVGLASYVLVPMVLISMLLLANFRIRSATEANYPIQTYLLYLQISLAVLFAFSFALAMIYRRNADLHARFMVCTALTLIDPVFARLFFSIIPDAVQYHQWMTNGLTDLILVILIFAERRSKTGRWVFPVMLVIFVAAQLPALLWLTNWPIWQSFAQWFKAIPLT
ncbi:MAG: hypothetical protein IPG67_08895 [Acidobacteria bacterium]|nr:hypothetical protein [Acidobacteriota bacterium]